MKTNYFLQILVMLFCVLSANAQQGINYKAIINDASGDALANTTVIIQFTILENETTEVFKELHMPTTDAKGILIVNIGEGILISGDFDTIHWESNPHFLKTEINSGGGLTDMGTTEFKTVPYALYAKDGSGAKELNDLVDVISDGSSLFVGPAAGINNDSGYSNTAIGTTALFHNTDGSHNTALGHSALKLNTEGSNNTASGGLTLTYNTTGKSNAANGYGALFANTTGNYNTAAGIAALGSNTTGSYNTANGRASLYFNTGGWYNTASGNYTLFNLAGGDINTAIGHKALYDLIDGYNNIGIGNDAQVPDSYGFNQVRIGNEEITYAGIQVPWTVTSDERWKEDIRSLPYGLDMIMKLKPVDYIRKNNEKLTREMGIIAQDLEKVLDEMGYEDQGFLIKDDSGYLHLRYNDLIALLTKAIQDQQDIIKSITSELEENKEEQKIINERLSQLEELLKTAQL